MEKIDTEYVMEDGEIKLVKRIVQKQEVPQDLKAVKLLIDGIREEITEDEIKEMITNYDNSCRTSRCKDFELEDGDFDCSTCRCQYLIDKGYGKIEKVRKETARQILSKIYKNLEDDIITKWDTETTRGYNACIYKLQSYIESLAKEYGVEVE